MARGKSEGESKGPGGVQWTGPAAPGDVGPAPPPPTDGIAAMLAELGAEGEVLVERQEPHWCAGFCGTWSVEGGDSVGFVERLQHELGGGVYLVRPLRRMQNGKKVYGAGSVRVRVSGAPRVQQQPQSQQQPSMGYIDATAREQPRAPAMREPGIDAMLAVLQPIATRLAALEAAITRPAQPVAPTGGLDLVGEMRKLAELRKLARELLGDGGRDDDDDDDDDDDEPVQQRLDPEALLAKFLESKLDPAAAAAPAAATATATRPRLIRNGVEVDTSGAPPPQAYPPPPQPMQGPPSAPVEAPANAAEAARAFGAKLASMPAADAVEFLAAVQASLPPELVAAMIQAAAAQQPPPQRDDDDDDGDDDPHAAAYR